MQHLCSGGENLTLDKELVPEIGGGLPTEGSNHYTNGNELSLSDGTPYVGYYHVNLDDAGNTMYMEGSYHTEESHQELTVYADKIIIPMGDVADYGSVSAVRTDSPFVIEKYIRIDNEKYSVREGYQKVRSQDHSQTIHQVYPGTLETVTAIVIENGEEVEKIVGITGEMGVRYGVELSIAVDGIKTEIISAEIDALDVPIGSFVSLEADSQNLLCLLKLLKQDNTFKLLTNYILALNKATATIAIYNDYAFMPSIGEETTPPDANDEETPDGHPGMKAYFSDKGEFQRFEKTAGWEYGDDRQPHWSTWWIKEWDSWDKVLLRNSKSRIKSLFRAHYETRKFDPAAGTDFDPFSALASNLKSSLLPIAWKDLLPGWKIAKVRSNPFNAKGELCKK